MRLEGVWSIRGRFSAGLAGARARGIPAITHDPLRRGRGAQPPDRYFDKSTSGLGPVLLGLEATPVHHPAPRRVAGLALGDLSDAAAELDCLLIQEQPFHVGKRLSRVERSRRQARRRLCLHRLAQRRCPRPGQGRNRQPPQCRLPRLDRPRDRIGRAPSPPKAAGGRSNQAEKPRRRLRLDLAHRRRRLRAPARQKPGRLAGRNASQTAEARPAGAHQAAAGAAETGNLGESGLRGEDSAGGRSRNIPPLQLEPFSDEWLAWYAQRRLRSQFDMLSHNDALRGIVPSPERRARERARPSPRKPRGRH